MKTDEVITDGMSSFALEEKKAWSMPIIANGRCVGSWIVSEAGIELETTIPIKIKSESGVTIESGEHIVTASRGDTVSIAAGMHHVQPSGGAYYDLVMSDAVGGEWRELMSKRQELYSEHEEASRRRQFYVMAARRALKHKKKKKRCGGGGCGC